MPRGDGTGPMGAGPMTGRAMGACAGYVRPGYMNPAGWGAPGLGFGRGRGFWGRGMGGGRGRRNMFYATGFPGWMRAGAVSPYFPPDAEAEKSDLKLQAQALQAELDAVKKRLSEIENGPAEEK